MRIATASAINCWSMSATAKEKLERAVKSAEMVTVVMARRLCPNGQAGWRSVGAASEEGIALRTQE
jgi:hypothetical protein